jgi:hypothetical protein
MMLMVPTAQPPPERRCNLFQQLLPLSMFWATTTATQNLMHTTAVPPMPHLITPPAPVLLHHRPLQPPLGHKSHPTVPTPCLLDISDWDSGALPWPLPPQPVATTWVKWHGWTCTNTIWSTPRSRHRFRTCSTGLLCHPTSNSHPNACPNDTTITTPVAALTTGMTSTTHMQITQRGILLHSGALS